MYIGAHVSIAGGFDKCIERSQELGSNALMTFASSPRSLQYSEIKKEILDKYLQKKTETQMGPHFFHAPYLINLASEDKKYVSASIELLIAYQQLAGEIGGEGTIVHIGSHKGRGMSQTIDQIVTSINYILDSSPKNIRLILENSAGQSGTIGSFEELGEIIKRIGDKSKLGVCLDTQHAFAAGVELKSIFEKFAKVISLKYLRVVHLNDSKTDFGSHLDRHENLGLGKIGKDSLKLFVSKIQDLGSNIPLILEVPGDGEGPRKKDIDYLKKMLI